MAAYIDKFQAYIAEIETNASMDYSNFRIKRKLLSNIENVEGISHPIQKCRDDECMTFAECAAFLKKVLSKLIMQMLLNL